LIYAAPAGYKAVIMQMLCILFLGCPLLLTAGPKLTLAEDEFGAALQGRDRSFVAAVLRRVTAFCTACTLVVADVRNLTMDQQGSSNRSLRAVVRLQLVHC